MEISQFPPKQKQVFFKSMHIFVGNNRIAFIMSNSPKKILLDCEIIQNIKNVREILYIIACTLSRREQFDKESTEPSSQNR